MSAHRTIFVWGMTGAGKSTVGPLLAERLGLPCVDLDTRIAERAGRTIAEIFAAEGEAGFRAREGVALTELCGGDTPRVVVLGGGALIADDRRRAARRAGTVVALTADLDTLIERLGGATDRPLLVGDLRTRLTAMATARAAAYADVDLVVGTDDARPEGVVERIVAALVGEVAA